MTVDNSELTYNGNRAEKLKTAPAAAGAASEVAGASAEANAANAGVAQTSAAEPSAIEGAPASAKTPPASADASVPKMRDDFKDYNQVKLDASVRLSPACTIVGDVSIGEDSSVFAGAHIRGDEAPIRIGSKTNIQENCCLHVSNGCTLTIGDGVTVGHGAILHGCTIADNVLVGMGSIIMDDAEIGEGSLVGAGALVTQRKKFPPRSLIIGSPAKAVRTLSEEEVAFHILHPAQAYAATSAAMVQSGVMEYANALAHVYMGGFTSSC